MFKWRSNQGSKTKQKTKQLWEGEFNIVSEGLDEGQVVAFVDNLTEQYKASQQASADSLRLLIEKAVADAEQIVTSIKMRAEIEAKEEAARAIERARQEAEEIKSGTEVAEQKEAEGVLPAADIKAEIAEIEAKQEVQPVQPGGEALEEPVQPEGEALEEPVQPEGEALEEKIEEPVQLEKEAAVSESVEATTEELPEQHLPEESPGKEEPETAQIRPVDSQALYAGEIELNVVMPVELKTVTKFYNYLQTLPDMKILYTRSSWDQGTTITVALDKPVPLISLISEIPDVQVIPELDPKDTSAKETSGSVLGARRKGIKRIKLTLKE